MADLKNRAIATGAQDFGKIIEYNSFYVDKTNFIKEWWENRDTVTMITRPRRFGKTLTMSMMEHFFSVEYAGRGDLFENLDIWKEEAYRELQGTYPVIFLSFASVKARGYKDAREGIIMEIADLYNQYSYLLNCDKITDREKAAFYEVDDDMSDMTAARSLQRLSGLLYKYYNKKVILLLDEYDTPMQEAFVYGYWEQLTEFLRGLFHAAFKTNPYLERGVMTGITSVAKESVFSDLNNLVIVTVTSTKYETAFGFTEHEVFLALEEYGLQDQMDEVRRWYDGFCIGDCDSIYNPWSVTRFLDEREFSAYWANTSSNRMISELIRHGGPDIITIMENLMKGQPFEAVIDEHIIFEQLDCNENAVWSLLLASGYLKVTDYKTDPKGKKAYVLDIVNLEVRQMFEDMFTGWFSVCSSSYNDFITALFKNDLKSMNGYMNRVALASMSFFDSGNKPSVQTEPERFYHGFVLGLMVDLTGRYQITSNRESGYGRYDVLLEPLNDKDDGILFEFKVYDSGDGEKDLKDTAKAAIAQIIRKNYAAALEPKCGKNRIRIYGFAFRGKEVLIDGGFIGQYLD